MNGVFILLCTQLTKNQGKQANMQLNAKQLSKCYVHVQASAFYHCILKKKSLKSEKQRQTHTLRKLHK